MPETDPPTDHQDTRMPTHPCAYDPCGAPIQTHTGGRPKRYCSPSCRQRDYLNRRDAGAVSPRAVRLDRKQVVTDLAAASAILAAYLDETLTAGRDIDPAAVRELLYRRTGLQPALAAYGRQQQQSPAP